MASFTEKLNLNWKDISGDSLTREISLVGDGIVQRSVALADPETDKQVALVLDVSTIKMLYMVSGVDLTLKTNSSSVPDDTISMLAGVPILFYAGSGYLIGDLFTADITTDIFLTTSGGGVSAFELRCVLDSTP